MPCPVLTYRVRYYQAKKKGKRGGKSGAKGGGSVEDDVYGKVFNAGQFCMRGRVHRCTRPVHTGHILHTSVSAHAYSAHAYSAHA
eukprot:1234351-Rhodomonas_salina.2